MCARRFRLRLIALWCLCPSIALAHDGSLVYLGWCGLLVPSVVTLGIVVYQLAFGRVRRWGVFSLAMLLSVPVSTVLAVLALYAWKAVEEGTDYMPDTSLPAVIAWLVAPLAAPVLTAWLVRRRLLRQG